MKRNRGISADRLRQLLDYDPQSGLFHWRVSRGNRAAGASAGGTHKANGYVYIRVDGETYLA